MLVAREAPVFWWLLRSLEPECSKQFSRPGERVSPVHRSQQLSPWDATIHLEAARISRQHLMMRAIRNCVAEKVHSMQLILRPSPKVRDLLTTGLSSELTFIPEPCYVEIQLSSHHVGEWNASENT